MKKSAFIVLFFVVIAMAVVAGCTQQAAQPSAPPPALPDTPAPPALPDDDEHSVTITASGFSPSTLTVKSGDTVVFINKDVAEHWPASAVHPTHAVYPEPGGCIASAFDACKGLAQGESFTFAFNQKGSWKYHDHLNCCSDPAFFGTIVVE